MSKGPVLEIEELYTYFHAPARQAFARSVNGVSLRIDEGETLGVVGESGSGKSLTALSVMGLVAGEPGVVGGKIHLTVGGERRDLLEGLDRFVRRTSRGGRIMAVEKDLAGWRRQSERVLEKVRGRQIAMIFQDPKACLNPFATIGRQIVEAIRLNTAIRSAKEARERALYWLDRVKIDSPRLRFDTHPYGLSGGMCQRAMIAMALACEPALLIADEPTTGLDATIQSKIVDLLAELKAELGTATMLISHDIDVIRRLADRVAVMYGGTVLESGPAIEVLASGAAGRHPYTAALLASVPGEEQVRTRGHLQAIEGDVPDTIQVAAGCRFYPRCRRATGTLGAKCREQEPPLREIAPGHEVRCWLFHNAEALR